MEQKYGRLTIISSESTGKYVRCNVRCDCGVEKEVYSHHLKSGATVSCGCYNPTNTKPRSDIKPDGESAFNKVYLFYRRNAKQRGYEFFLTKEEFKPFTKQNCHYCNSEPSQVSKHSHHRFSDNYIYNGLDRIDNTQGYSLTNCVPCCKICNRAKGNLTLEEFKEWIRKLYDSSRE